MAYNFTDRGNMVGKKPRQIYWTELQDAVNDLDEKLQDYENENIPTKLSQLTKDINFDERYYTETEIDAKLSDKVDNSRVLTDVPANAKFTDTITTINDKTGAISKSDIVALGIPAQDTTYGIATTSTNGLMSATDKAKLNGIEAGANKTTVNNTLTSTSTTQALSAKQGKVLNDKLVAHKAEKATQEQLGHVKAGQNITIDSDGTINAKGGNVDSVNGKTGEVILSASDVGSVPTSRRVNNKTLTSNITIDVSDIPGLVSSILVLGESASVAGDYSVALGESASAGEAAVALGRLASAAGDYSVALGYNASAEASAVALGQSASAAGAAAVALGLDTEAVGDYSVALGYNASAEASAVALGYNASAAGNYSVALGYDSSATGTRSVALGGTASAESYSVALGRDALAAGDYSIALGFNAWAAKHHSVALGNGASAENLNEGILGGVGSSRTSKWIVPGDFTVSGTKNFEIPHPKPEKSATHVIRHGAVESPTPGDTLYRYKIQATRDNDIVTIDLPDYFIWLNKDVQIFVTPQGHFGNGYGELNRETEQLEIHCQFAGEYNVLVIGTRNDDHQSVQDWNIKGVEREIGESWTGETYAFSVDEIMEVEEIKEVV